MGQDQYKYLKLNRYAVLYSNVSLTKQEQSQFRQKKWRITPFYRKKTTTYA